MEFLKPSFKKILHVCFVCNIQSLITVISQKAECGHSHEVAEDRVGSNVVQDALCRLADLSQVVTSDQGFHAHLYSERTSEYTYLLGQSADLMAVTLTGSSSETQKAPRSVKSTLTQNR